MFSLVFFFFFCSALWEGTLYVLKATQSLTQAVSLFSLSHEANKKSNVLLNEAIHCLIKIRISDNNYYTHINLIFML